MKRAWVKRAWVKRAWGETGRWEIDRERNELQAIAQGDDPELVQLARDELALMEQREMETAAAGPERESTGRETAILEVRAGTGGQEAAIFAADLLRMYLHYAQAQGWDAEITESRTQEPRGVSQAVLELSGREVFRKLRHESGTHRVQRIPATEAQGRIHTSTATVAVLREAETAQVVIKQEDLRIDTMRGSGHGGQAVNKLATAVRIVHVPTGTTVTCHDERSLKHNRERALASLQNRLLLDERRRIARETAGERRSQVGTADRTEKVRTYNHPQNRVTDHRLRRGFRPMQRILDGGLEPIVTALAALED